MRTLVLQKDERDRAMDDVTILYTTWPDAETATAFAQVAVETRLAACANVLASMTSVYRWDGKLQCEAETPMLLKTTAAMAPRLRDAILQSHPYDVPCVVALGVEAAASNPAFVRWIGEQIG
jgi:periplasmic divalent cation tolerance protein